MESGGEVVGQAVAGGAFMGRFVHALDPKRRLTIPAGWRELMGNPRYVYVVPDPRETCLNLVSTNEMELRLAKLRQRGLFERDATEALRKIGEHSEFLSLDVQGRIRIRDGLLDFAGLADQVVMIGAGLKVQLWSPALRPEPQRVDQEGLARAFETVEL